MASQTAAAFRKAIRSVADADGSGVSDRELLRRFAAAKDQAAFAALVGRHSEMVLGVCRRSLSNLQDAEDAAQATFLVLARKAGSMRWQTSVANWLYDTARKVAHNARVAARRRARREARAAVPEAVPPVDRMTGRELLAALDEELDKLPPRYREPLILCCLEGLARDEAAARLGVVPGTLKVRLVRGRKRLGEALSKRGVVLGVGLLALAATSPAEASPPRFVRAVLAAVSGKPSAAAAELAKGVAVKGIITKAVVAAFAAAGAAALGLGLGAALAPAPVPAAAAQEQRPARDEKPPPRQEKEVPVSGRVLDPDGKPVAGAAVVQVAWNEGEDRSITELARSDGEGRFRCTVTPSERAGYKTLVARADGFAADWIELSGGRRPEPEVVFRLAKADVPVRGRVLTLEGKPVAGAVVRVGRVYAPDGKNTLKQVYEAWPGDPDRGANLLQKMLHAPVVGGLPEAVTADAEGRFEIKGVGDGRLLMLEVTADTIEHAHVRVAVDADFDPKAVTPDPTKADPRRPGRRVGPPLYGPAFDHAARPGRVITGTVTDAKMGKPLAGVTVSGHLPPGQGWWEDGVHARTDADGKYRLIGLPNAACELAFGHADPAAAYLMLTKTVAPTEGLSPATCDMTMVRGVVFTGRVTDAATGKPINGGVRYAPLSGNKEVLALPGRDVHMMGVMSHRLYADGRYRFVAPAGPGILVVQADTWAGDRKPYTQVRLRAEDRDKPYFRVEPDLGERFITAGGTFQPLMGWHAYRVLEPAAEAESVMADFSLDPGKQVKGKVLGPDGEPLKGATVAGLSPTWETPGKLDGDEFTAEALAPDEVRQVAAVHTEKKLAGVAQLSADGKGEAVIRLAPWGAVTGRVVDQDGKPVAGAAVRLLYSGQVGRSLSGGPVTTDAEGRFRADAPFADTRFLVTFSQKGQFLDAGQGFRDLKVTAGETKDLGDVKVTVGD